MSGAWLAQRERGSQAAMRALVWVTLALGRPFGRALLYPICAYFALLSRGARRASTDYLGRVLGRQPRTADVMRHFHAFASTIHDRVYLRAGRYAYFDVRLDVPPSLLAQLRAGRGCILLGSHLGSFEILRAAGLAERAPAVNMLMRVEGTQQLNGVIDALAPEAAPRVIPLGHPGSLLRAQECLERGEIVGILADRGLREERECACRFLGAPARFPLGPLLLAGLLQAPVMLAFGLYRGGRRYDVHLEPFAERIELDRRDREGSLRPWIERYAARLEHYCREAPCNWFNFYDFWAPAPPRTPAPLRAGGSRERAK
ncbi:MAG TPA: acyl-CoA synthetase [Burkholderiales bacterium]|nr:acyl-CoA synthetase [Burkholderiales bacterium]